MLDINEFGLSMEKILMSNKTPKENDCKKFFRIFGKENKKTIFLNEILEHIDHLITLNSNSDNLLFEDLKEKICK